MSGRGGTWRRARGDNQQYQQEWRDKKYATAKANYQYTRDKLLSLFKLMETPANFTTEIRTIKEIYSEISQNPLSIMEQEFNQEVQEQQIQNQQQGHFKSIKKENIPEWYVDKGQDNQNLSDNLASFFKSAEQMQPKDQQYQQMPSSAITEDTLLYDQEHKQTKQYVQKTNSKNKQVKIVLESQSIKNMPKHLQDIFESEKEIKEEYGEIDIEIEEKLKQKQFDDVINILDQTEPVQEHESDQEANEELQKAQSEWDAPGPVDNEGWGLTLPQQKDLIQQKETDFNSKQQEDYMAKQLEHSLKILDEEQQNSRKTQKQDDGDNDLQSKQYEQKNMEILPQYSLHTLHKEIASGNPFANLLLYSGQVENDVLFIIPNSQAYEKSWYYKDPSGNIQGPFNSIEMYHWSLAGYFDLNLLVACGQKEKFTPLGYFYELEKQRYKMETMQAQYYDNPGYWNQGYMPQQQIPGQMPFQNRQPMQGMVQQTPQYQMMGPQYGIPHQQFYQQQQTQQSKLGISVKEVKEFIPSKKEFRQIEKQQPETEERFQKKQQASEQQPQQYYQSQFEQQPGLVQQQQPQNPQGDTLQTDPTSELKSLLGIESTQKTNKGNEAQK